MTPYIKRLIAALLFVWIGLGIGAYFRVPDLITTHLKDSSWLKP